MIAPGTNAKPKIESKPLVENKAAAQGKTKLRRPRILFGILALVVAVTCAALLTYPYWNRSEGQGPVKATLALDPFLVNLADTGEVRFVKTAFQLGFAEEPDDKVINSVAMAAIRDSIISLLSSKKAEQILTPEGKLELRQEIRSRVNTLLPGTKVLEVYIVDFVVQL